MYFKTRKSAVFFQRGPLPKLLWANLLSYCCCCCCYNDVGYVTAVAAAAAAAVAGFRDGQSVDCGAR